MLRNLLNWWRDKPEWCDFLILLTVCLAGLLAWPKIIIGFAAGLLAASPVWKYVTMAEEYPHIDARHVVRQISFEIIGYSIIGSIAAYLSGSFVRWLFWG